MPWTQVCCVGRPVIIHHTIAIGHTQAHACMCDVHVYRADVLYILDWWLDVCTGLVCYMYWTGCVELDWFDVCTGLGTGIYTVLYEGREGGEALHAGGWWWEALDTGIHPQNFR